MLFLWFVIFCYKLGLIFGQEGPIVTIPDGKLRGAISQTVGANISFYLFRGIPFAKKPIGNLRFASPVKNNKWTGTHDATEDKDFCTQPASLLLGQTNETVIGSEDCLYVNVYTTNLNGSLPVMVWIYGGGFISGSSAYAFYAPDYIIEKKCSLRVIQLSTRSFWIFELFIFNTFSTEDSACHGNWGLKDQVLALRWVQNNIQYFGGDPTKVTIFGQSAGAASISYLLQSDKTAGLYGGAIMQSGTSLCLWALTRNARRKAFKVGSSLGITASNSQTLIQKLRKVDYKALSIAEAGAILTDSILAGLPFGVVKEPAHSGAIFSERSHPLLENGMFYKIPLIIGYTSNEGGALQQYVDSIRWASFLPLHNYQTRFAPYDLSTRVFRKIEANNEIKRRYFKHGVAASTAENITKFFTVDQFMRPIREAARLFSSYTNAYYYRFSYEGVLGNPNSTYEGVGHSDDLNYLFDRSREASPEDSLTRDKFITLWTNFAKTRDPSSTDNDNSIILEDLIWEPNQPFDDTITTIKYLNIGETFTMETNPDQPDWFFYKNAIYREYGDPPYATY